MKLFNNILASVLVASSAFAADKALSVTQTATPQNAGFADFKTSIDAGYTSAYVVNGTARTKNRPFAGLAVSADYGVVDVYVGGTVVPGSTSLDESHWYAGVGKSYVVNTNFTLRGDLQVFRHQSAIVGGVNSTEGVFKLALQNKYVTPYIKGVYDFNLDQYGYIVGGERATDVFGLFVATPSVEYGQLTDYDFVAVKLRVSRQIIKHLEAFGEVGWYDNDFSVSKYNFAVKEFSGDVVASGGLRWVF